jgi:CHASE3 domain sensor protein
MPITSSTFSRATLAIVFAGALVLVGIVLASLWLVDRTGDHAEELVAAQQIRARSSGLLTRLQDAETAQRGYVITQDDGYLEPYEVARTRIPELLDDLRSRLSERPADRALVDRIALQAEAKMAELEGTIVLVRAGRQAEAVAVVRTNRGKDAMEALRESLRELILGIDARIAGSIASTRSSADLLSWSVVFGAIFIALLAGGSVWMSVRYTRDLLRARQEVQELNFGLEERVADRTSELARANDEIQRFAYIVSHDLRAPLVNVMGFTSELEVCLATLQSAMSRRRRARSSPTRRPRRARPPSRTCRRRCASSAPRPPAWTG